MRGMAVRVEAIGRSAFLALAMLALACFFTAPPGYMLAPELNHGFALVICPGQGGSDHAPPGGGPDRHERGGDMCPLAHLGAAHIAPSAASAMPAAYVDHHPVVTTTMVDQTPGRGLAAPPPLPARGPPRPV